MRRYFSNSKKWIGFSIVAFIGLMSVFQNCARVKFSEIGSSSIVGATNDPCQYTDVSSASIGVSKDNAGGALVDPNSISLNDTGYFRSTILDSRLSYVWTVLTPASSAVTTTGPTAEVKFTATGNYQISLKVKRDACVNESPVVTRSIAITPSIIRCPDINSLSIGGASAGIPNQSLGFNLAIPVLCPHATVWDMDANLAGMQEPQSGITFPYSQDNIAHSYSSSGIYLLKSGVSYTAGGSKVLYKPITISSGTNCDLDALNILGPQNLAPQQEGAFSIAIPTICEAQTVVWDWNDSSGRNPASVNATVFSGNHAWMNSGAYTLRATLIYLVGGVTQTRIFILPVQVGVIAGCACTNKDFSILDIYGPTQIRMGLTASFAVPALSCLGTTTLNWTFGNGSSPDSGTGNSASTMYSAAGAKEVSAQVTSENCGVLTRKLNLSANSCLGNTYLSGTQCVACPAPKDTNFTPNCQINQAAVPNSGVKTTSYSCQTGNPVPTIVTSNVGQCNANPVTCSPSTVNNSPIACGAGYNGGTKFTTTTTTCPDGAYGTPAIATSAYNLSGCSACPVPTSENFTPTNCAANQTPTPNSGVRTTSYSCTSGTAVPTIVTSNVGQCNANPVTCSPSTVNNSPIACGAGYNGGTKFTTTTTTCPDGAYGTPAIATSAYNLSGCSACPVPTSENFTPTNCAANQTPTPNSGVRTTSYSCTSGTAVATTATTSGACVDNPPLACGTHASGSTWQESGTENVSRSCPGSRDPLTDVYNTTTNKTCTNGITSSGSTQQGSLQRSGGTCPYVEPAPFCPSAGTPTESSTGSATSGSCVFNNVNGYQCGYVGFSQLWMACNAAGGGQGIEYRKTATGRSWTPNCGQWGQAGGCWMCDTSSVPTGRMVDCP